jgi:hypothetical protein
MAQAEAHRVYGTSLKKNMMERFVKYLKDRTECFDDHFPCQKKDCDICSMCGTG